MFVRSGSKLRCSYKASNIYTDTQGKEHKNTKCSHYNLQAPPTSFREVTERVEVLWFLVRLCSFSCSPFGEEVGVAP